MPRCESRDKVTTGKCDTCQFSVSATAATALSQIRCQDNALHTHKLSVTTQMIIQLHVLSQCKTSSAQCCDCKIHLLYIFHRIRRISLQCEKRAQPRSPIKEDLIYTMPVTHKYTRTRRLSRISRPQTCHIRCSTLTLRMPSTSKPLRFA